MESESSEPRKQGMTIDEMVAAGIVAPS